MSVFGLRGKLLAGLAGLLAVLIAVTVLSNSIIIRYSDSIQKLFHDDYGSATASQAMKEAVETMTAIAERRVWEDKTASLDSARPSIEKFNRDLAMQDQLADVPGEAQADGRLEQTWKTFLVTYRNLFDPSLTSAQRRQLYTTQLLPQSHQVRAWAQRVIDMNIRFMSSGRGKAELKARHAHLAMQTLTGMGVGIAAIIVILCGTIVLRPLRLLIRSAKDIAQGKLELSLDVHSHDEIGQLARAFNQMAAQLREFKRLDHEKLVRTQHTTQLAIDSLPDAVIVLDPVGKIELANETALRLFELRPGLAIGECRLRSLAEIFEVPGGGNAAKAAGYRAAIRVEDDGRTRYFLPRTYDVRDEAKALIGVVVVLVDVTDFRRLDEMKNNLLSMVAHELKTPLTSMRMIMHLLGEGRAGDPAEQRELIVAAREDTDRLHEIIENLMDMGRLESGKALMDVHATDANELVRRCIQPLEASFENRGVVLTLDLPENALTVKADETRMLHVFGNLLSNALRYTPARGSVTVSVRAGEGEAEFSVSDTGEGIAAEHLPRLFDKFFRVPGQAGGTGSGLGLAIVKDVVDAHGGRIWVESRPGAGTTFFFTLPTVAQPVEESSYAGSIN